MSTELAEGVPADIFGLVGTVLDRKFRVEKIIAEGGFGVVYYGVHLTLEKPIAIKVLKTPAEFNEKARAQFIEKFALEGKTMARISHPSIVQVLDFGASAMPSGDLAPWMVLEWLTGQTLESLLLNRRSAGQGRFSPEETIQTLRPVFDALAYAHDEGIAHRDIKPANMMVVQGKRGSTLRLMDFGIAKLMEEGESAGSGATRTRTTMNAFSPQYAAPEQISGTRTGPWTDVHAIALIMTEMLTGVPPYEGDDMTTLFGQILSPLRPTPARRGVDVGPWEPVMARALTMKPDDRFKNMGEFLNALDQALPSAARPYGSVTGNFQALQDQSSPHQVPMAFNPTQAQVASPTTLRGSAMTTGVHSQQESKAPMVIGLAVVAALAIGGGVFFLNRGKTPAPYVSPVVVRPPVPVVHAPPPNNLATQPVAGGGTETPPVNPLGPANGTNGSTAVNTPPPNGGANTQANGNAGGQATGNSGGAGGQHVAGNGNGGENNGHSNGNGNSHGGNGGHSGNGGNGGNGGHSGNGGNNNGGHGSSGGHGGHHPTIELE